MNLAGEPKLASTQVDPVRRDQVRAVGHEVGDDFRHLRWVRDMDQIGAFVHMPTDVLSHPPRIGDRLRPIRLAQVRSVADAPVNNMIASRTIDTT